MTALFISTSGQDNWSGTLDRPNAAGTDGPFASLERARDEIRQRRRRQEIGPGGITVEIGAGTYQRQEAFVLTAEDSGAEGAPVTYAARGGEIARLIGGQVLEGFSPVEDPAIRERLDPPARDHVLQIDLKARGIADFGEAGGGGLELFFDDEPMTLARWPNEGFVKIADLVGGDPVEVRGTKGDKTGKFKYDGDRPRRWLAENDPWVHGYWFWDWSDQRHRIDSIDASERVISVEPPYHSYGYRIGQWFYAYNILAELDAPGEWYLDRESGILYFWPPRPIDEGTAAVSLIDTLVQADGAEYISLRGFALETARGTALTARDSSHLRVEGCAFRNLGGWAVQASGGHHVEVKGCDICQTGNGGISLTGGDRGPLKRGEHLAEDNHIHHYGRWNRMYQSAIAIGGVGHRVSHNLIHDAPHMAVSFNGNDHLIEYNEIHHVCLESNDAGAMYSGRDWTWRGTVIRHNLLYEITGFEDRGCVGVYLDDMLCGTRIYGNLFYRVTRAAFIGGGRDCVVENNIFVDCEPALHIDNRAMNWAGYHVGTTMKDRLEEVPYRESHWAEKYPELLTLWEDEPAAPKGNIVRRNVCQGGTWDEVSDGARPYVILEDNLVAEDVGLVGAPPEDFGLKDGSPAFDLGFQAIPLAKIGLCRQGDSADD